MARMLARLALHILPLTAALPSEHNIFARQNNRCGGDSSLTPCGNGFPANFCCGAETRCVPLNNTRITTTICCPNGRDCSRIQPIACNITLQNAQLFPQSSMHTLNLTQELPKCKDACCPAGFRCDNNECAAINDRQQSSSSSTPPASSSTPASSRPASSTGTGSTTSATSTTSSTASPAMPIETLVPEGSSTFNGKSFAAGFIPGIAIGAALLFGIFFLLARRRRKREEVTEMTTPPASSDGFSSAKAAFARRKTRRQISDPIVQPEFSTRTAFYHYGSPSKTGSDITTSTAPSPPDTSTVEKALPIPHTRKRSSSAYETNTSGLPSTPFSHTTSNFAVPSLFHQTPSPAPPAIPTTTPLPFPPAPPTPKGSTTPPHPLRQKSSQRSLRRQLSRFRKTSAPSPSLAHLSRTSSKRRRVGSWSSGDDRSLSGDERGGNGRESRGTIRVVMSPPRQGPLPMGFGPVLRANMPPPSWAGGAGGGSGGAGAGGVMGPRSGEGDGGGMHPILPEGMAYAHTDLPYPERIVVANMGEKRQGLGVGQGQGSGAGQGQGYNLRTPPRVPGQVQGGLGSPYTPSKHRGGQGAGDRGTTFGEMMERAGVGRQDLERGRGV